MGKSGRKGRRLMFVPADKTEIMNAVAPERTRGRTNERTNERTRAGEVNDVEKWRRRRRLHPRPRKRRASERAAMKAKTELSCSDSHLYLPQCKGTALTRHSNVADSFKKLSPKWREWRHVCCRCRPRTRATGNAADMKKRKSAIDEMIWESSSDLGAHLEFWKEGGSKRKRRRGKEGMGPI